MSPARDSEIVTVAQKVQTLALVWLEREPAIVLPRVCDVLREIPHFEETQDRVALAVMVRRVAEAFVRSRPLRELNGAARLRRTHVSDVHVGRALQIIRQEFARPDLGLRRVADACRVSPAYLSRLMTVTTRYGFRTHLSVVRLLHAAHLLATTPLSIEEVADQCGWRSTAILDHEFKRWFSMPPGEFRRWAT
jgi:transcriptional regulator GlxA family with amidase domain